MKRLQSLTSNVWFKVVSVFGATVISDYVWARYMLGISSGDAIEAANFAVVVIVLGAFLVVSYVQDKRLVIPAAIGAWIGTYIAL